MRTRHSTGGVRKQRGRWRGFWYEGGVKKSKVVGFVKDMTKGQAREAVAKIVAEIRAKHETPRKFGEFVEAVYFPYYSRKWKHSTRENNVNRIEVHLVEAYRERQLGSFKRDELQDLLDAKAKEPFLLDGRSPEMGFEANFRHGVGGGANRSKPRPAAVYAEGSEKAGSPRDDD